VLLATVLFQNLFLESDTIKKPRLNAPRIASMDIMSLEKDVI
jgi:hypothetical protein